MPSGIKLSHSQAHEMNTAKQKYKCLQNFQKKAFVDVKAPIYLFISFWQNKKTL
jgi:hypothetical protein